MRMKTNILGGIIISIVLLIAGLALVFYPKSSPTQSTTAVSTQTVSPTASVITPESGMQIYSEAQVSAHNSSQSCWSIIEGKVYDLTAYIPRHKGGPEKIIAICGKDGTAEFSEEHDGKQKPAIELAKMYLGDLQ